MVEDALGLALQGLARKERSVAETASWLRGRGVGEEAVEEAVEALLASGALDDGRFASRFAADKRELGGWGAERIRSALLQRGISSEEIEAALAEDGDELERAERVLRGRRLDLGDDRGRGRALAMLVRLGYDADLAYEAVRRAEASR